MLEKYVTLLYENGGAFLHGLGVFLYRRHISLVVHAISRAFTLKIAASLYPLVEFPQIARQVLALQNSFPSPAPYFC